MKKAVIKVGGKQFIVKVSAKVVDELVKGEKIRVIRYKAKKRVHKENGHRQKYTKIEITSIK